jgi:16S rRNA processing protein RimM
LNAESRSVSVGAVGKPHGRDGSFYVERPDHDFEVGTELSVGGRSRRVEQRGGTDERPLVRLAGVEGREDATALRGESLLVELALVEGEWLASDLVGCRIDGMGEVRRVMAGPSCDVLELDDGSLVPLVSDAVRGVDLGARRIEVNRRFLGLDAQ